MKTCKKCSKELTLDNYTIIKSGYWKGKPLANCKSCESIRRSSLPVKEVSIDERECIKCHEIKPADCFSRDRQMSYGLQSICKVCHYARQVKIASTFEGYMRYMIRTTKNSAKTRSKRKRDDTSGDHTLTAEFLKEMWQTQKGRCFYSGLDMKHEMGVDWQCSVERLDNSKGYVQDNVVLVCLEFNGKVQMSRDKIKYLVENFK